LDDDGGSDYFSRGIYGSSEPAVGRTGDGPGDFCCRPDEICDGGRSLAERAAYDYIAEPYGGKYGNALHPTYQRD